MFSRRDALRMVAALSAANALPLAISPAEADALLDEPMDAGAHELYELPRGADNPPSAVMFADAIERSLQSDKLPVWFSDAAPLEWATYKQQYATVSHAVSAIIPTDGITPLSILDEFVVALCSACWSAGLVAGAEVEHLRQALIKPSQVCTTCNGYGVLHYHTVDEQTPSACTRCRGAGIVPTGAV